jgi:GGDEF domain-containing protein
VLRVADLTALNQAQGRARTDAWLVAVAEALQGGVAGVEEATLARLGGAEFGILLPGLRIADGQACFERACSAVAALDLQGSGPRLAAACGGGDLPAGRGAGRCWRGSILR